MIRIAIFITAFAASAMSASAEVRFGKNVRVGGHDASNQTFTKKNRGEYIIYDKQPKNAGCKIRKNNDGTRTKVCHLKRKKPKQSDR